MIRSRAARLLLVLQRWADAGWAGSVLYTFGLVQSSVVPGPADVLFAPLALANPRRAYYLAAVASAGTISGSTLLYFVGREGLYLVEGTIASLMGMTPEAFAAARGTLARYGGWGIFLSTVSPISTKLTSLASGAVGVPFLEYFAFLAAGRTMRTFAIAWFIRNGGALWLRRLLGLPERAGPPVRK